MHYWVSSCSEVVQDSGAAAAPPLSLFLQRFGVANHPVHSCGVLLQLPFIGEKSAIGSPKKLLIQEVFAVLGDALDHAIPRKVQSSGHSSLGAHHAIGQKAPQCAPAPGTFSFWEGLLTGCLSKEETPASRRMDSASNPASSLSEAQRQRQRAQAAQLAEQPGALRRPLRIFLPPPTPKSVN